MLSVSLSTDTSGNQTVNMSIAAGDTVAETVTINNGSTPLNLTGYTVKMTIAFAAHLLLSTGNGGITLTDPTNGVCQINIADSVSAAFTPGIYAFDFWIISGSGVATRLFTGTFTVSASITAIP